MIPKLMHFLYSQLHCQFWRDSNWFSTWRIPCFLSRSNVLKLNIFYEELNYEVIREERSYEVGLREQNGYLLEVKQTEILLNCVTEVEFIVTEVKFIVTEVEFVHLSFAYPLVDPRDTLGNPGGMVQFWYFVFSPRGRGVV